MGENPMLHTNLMTLYFIEPESSYGHLKFYIVGTGIFYLFSSSDLDLDPLTFIYESDPYSMEIYQMCKYELPISRLSKVIIRQTDTTEITYHATSQVVNKNTYYKAYVC